MSLSRERIVQRYCHLHPHVDGHKLKQLLCTSPNYLKWAGCDLINTTDAKGGKSMVIIETVGIAAIVVLAVVVLVVVAM